MATHDPYRYFRVEARDLLEQMGRGVLELERGASAELVVRLLRLAHTLKGAARVVKQRDIADRAHAFEDVLGPHRAGGSALGRGDIDTLLGQVDTMTAALAALDAPPATPGGIAPAPVAPVSPAVPAVPAVPASAVAAAASTRAAETPRSARPDSEELSEVLDGIGEIHAQIGALRKVAQRLDETRLLAARLGDARGRRNVGGVGGSAGPRAARDAWEQPLALEELTRTVERMQAGLNAGLDQLERETAQTREAANRLRLVPADALFTALQRTVRDAALAIGKQASFAGRGGDVRLEPQALAAVQAALVQLVRNAVAHGIEAPEVRRAAGKEAEGRVTVTIQRRQVNIVCTCTDDGGGVDLAAVRRSARQRGLLSDTADGAAASDVMALLLRGGISTSTVVTELSGRGVGLDLAREAVAELGGSLAIDSRPGAGTTVTLTIPAVLAAVPALVVDSGGNRAAIPLDAVRGALRFEPEDVARRPDGDALIHEGRVIPLMPLSSILGGTGNDTVREQGRLSALVIEGPDGARAALSVDRLLGTATLVSRPLPARAAASPVVAGAWTDADGTPRLVLDPAALIELCGRPRARSDETPKRRAPILVIDDSLTTRMLEQSILESAGYEVELAASAEEGLEKATGTRYALFLVDIEMPGMDGFTFVAQTRRDPVLREVPAILVSSRSAPEDLRRGMEAGASAYVVKGDFDQGALLDRIRTLVG